MKKTLLAAIIAATALVPPALAQDRGHRWGGGNRSDGGTSQAQPAPSYQGNRGGNWRQSAPVQSQTPAAQPQRQWNGGTRGERPQWNGQNNGGWNRGDRGGQAQRPQPQQQAVLPPTASPQQAAPQRNWNGNRGNNGQWNRGNNGQWNRGGTPGTNGQFNRGNPGWNDRRGNDNRGWNSNRGNDNRSWSGNRGSWNNGWRNDRRYDWRGYRNTNRGLYRLPRYYAPSGWGYGYRRFTIGYTLSSLLFSSQYWINDPFYYRLPEVYGPYRWVRYYNDALLVDIETGEVVDTIYDIFW
jgi:hypothetical protein